MPVTIEDGVWHAGGFDEDCATEHQQSLLSQSSLPILWLGQVREHPVQWASKWWTLAAVGVYGVPGVLHVDDAGRQGIRRR